MLTFDMNRIGHATVLRTFTFGDRRMRTGDRIERDELMTMRTTNRNALFEKNFMQPWPRETEASGGVAAALPSSPVAHEGASAVATGRTRRFVVPRGFGKYDVVEGVKLNKAILDREAAHKLAGLPLDASAEVKPKRRN